MGFLVHVLNRIGSDTILNEARKLAFEGLFIFFLEALHVISYMLSKDVSSVNIGTELTSLFVISWESLLTVGDIKTTISCTFHGSKNLGTSGSSGQTNFDSIVGQFMAVSSSHNSISLEA